METKDNFSEQESFMIINEMINSAKFSIADKSFPYLLWGWLVFIASILNYLLLVVVKTDLNWLPWPILMFSGGIVSMIYAIKEKRRERVRTYVDRFLGYTWSGIMIGLFLLVFVGTRLGVIAVYPMLMILYGIGLYISGRAFSFMPLIIGSIGCWICAAVSCYVSFEIQLVLLGLAVLTGYIIPGHILKLKFRHETTR